MDRNPILVAIDTPDEAAARALVAAVASAVGGVKLGLEFFVANGPRAAKAAAGGQALFLDLKLHDIPNTVAGAVRAAAALEPLLLTIHATGGPAMMRAAAEAAAGTGRRRMKLVGVTVLTSLDEADLASVGQAGPIADQALRLALLARASGLDGVVCSPHEVAGLRAACGQEFLLVVPGIRPAGASLGDQKRVMGPREAIAAGANYLVIGRPITAAPDPGAAARVIAAELA
ncbi:MAG TPA: orotidine-5'-phosphate decarboxylase [Stellaceae bacterium]|nr:orotidine-5'-phosphate decarboxylase [Stellaceae bacterium]